MPGPIHLLTAKELSTKPAKPVTSFKEIVADADKMLDLLDHGIVYENQIVGAVAISHAQVCAEPFSFFVLDKKFKEFTNNRRIIINPKIVDQKELVPFSEGCLSFHDREYAKTKRFRFVTVEWQFPGQNGEIHSRTKREAYEGLPAMIFQHEIDHSAGMNIYTKFLEENRV